MKDLLEFCREHGTPKLRAATDGRLLAYLSWAARKGFLVVVGGKDGRIVGLGIGWPCDPQTPTTPNVDGHTLYIANIACRTPAALVTMLDEGARRWPNVRAFAGHRTDLLVGYGVRHARLLYRLAKGQLERN